jgi:NADPH:quinone reductase-like Zn-dependent oxidoreductase
LNQIRFEADTVWSQPLGELDVEVKIKAIGLNFRDVVIAMGEHHALTLGGEAAGIVTRIGSTVTRVKVGSRCVQMDGHNTSGAGQTYARVIEDLTVELPEGVSFEAATSLPTIFSLPSTE